ncbi:MAG: low molecular weight protein-tyrosine-phosphatase [Planctomycetota bacterium]
MPSDQKPTRVLFVCLGNICRSPLAEGVFLHLAAERGLSDSFHVASAGTGGWHAGEEPDPRSIAVARKNGVTLPSRARQVTANDVGSWDCVVAMDGSNRSNLIGLGFDPAAVHLMRSFDASSQDQDVPDPYYGGPDGFDDVYAMIHRACEGLLDHLVTSNT